MADIYLYAFVEDAPSQAVLYKIINHVNNERQDKFVLNSLPVITHGFGNLKRTALRFANAAKNDIWSIFVTDLDQYPSPNALCRDWFDLPCCSLLPHTMIFRVAVREIESWIIADKKGIAEFLNVSDSLFPDNPDRINDPKKLLIETIRTKCHRKKYREMLPEHGQSVGIAYNSMLADYIARLWDINRAAAHSPSLRRAIRCMKKR